MIDVKCASKNLCFKFKVDLRWFFPRFTLNNTQHTQKPNTLTQIHIHTYKTNEKVFYKARILQYFIHLPTLTCMKKENKINSQSFFGGKCLISIFTTKLTSNNYI